MELVANCMDWARHRRRKAAAKQPIRAKLSGFHWVFSDSMGSLFSAAA